MFRVYISGPITAPTHDEERVNVEKAADLAYWCVTNDMAIYWPHGSWYVDMQAIRQGQKPLEHEYLKQDFEWILQCNALIYLPAGPDSCMHKEVAFARKHGVPVVKSEDRGLLLELKEESERQAHYEGYQIKDSRTRRTFSSGAERDRGDNKPRPDLISPFMMKRLGQHLRLGAVKYSERNWEKGMPAKECLASLCRHVEDFKEGLKDEDHLSAIIFNAMAIMHYEAMVARGVLPESLLDLQSYTKGEDDA